jgi:chromosome segregation ATPase
LEKAAEYLGEYQDANDAARDLAIDIAEKINTITLLQAYYSTGDANYYATLTARAAQDLADAEATLAIAEASLETIIAVAAGDAEAQAELDAVKAQLQDIDNQILALNIDLSETDKALDDANDDLADADDDLSDAEDDLEDAEDAQDAIDGAIADKADALAAAIAASADLAEELEPFVSRYETVAFNNLNVAPQTAEFAHRLAIAGNALKAEAALSNANPSGDNSDGYSDALDEVDALIDEINDFVDTEDNIPDFDSGDYGAGGLDGDVNVDWTTGDVDTFIADIENLLDNPDPESEAGATQGLASAIEAFFNGGAADVLIDDIGRFDGQDYIDYVSDLADALADGATVTEVDFDDMPETGNGNGSNGWDDYWAANDDLYDALEDFGFYDGSEDAWESIDADAAAASTELAGDVADAQADVDAAQAAYDAAEAVVDGIEATREPFNDEIDSLNDQLDALSPVEDALEAYIDGINADIEDFEADVKDAQDAVDAAEYWVAELAAMVVEEVDAKIVYEQARLAELQLELAAKQAEAAAWLALLNDALGN